MNVASTSPHGDVLANPFWSALTTEQASFSIGSGHTRRYSSDVLPFAAIESSSPDALAALHDLLAPEESAYVVAGDLPNPEASGIALGQVIPCWQMHLATLDPEHPPHPHPTNIRGLSAEDAPAMVALTDLAFPGFFRARTHMLGRYFGIHLAGELVAMAGERIALPGYRELSAICTHPAHTGKGYAAALIDRLLRAQAATSHRSFLHVTQSNHRAIALYERLGFVRSTPIIIHRIHRL